jgi:hypothetical protein
MGVRIGGVDKITYCHFDAYPSGLGESVVADVRALLRDPGIEGFKQLATALRVVDEQGEKPTEADRQRLKQFTDLDVSTRSEDDWYCLTRHLQGEFAKTLKVGIMTDSRSFLGNSLFCEFAYIVNLDEMAFEAYAGFQHEPHSKGRYCDLPHTRADYWPVALVGSFDLADIPQNWDEQAFPQDEEE